MVNPNNKAGVDMMKGGEERPFFSAEEWLEVAELLERESEVLLDNVVDRR